MRHRINFVEVLDDVLNAWNSITNYHHSAAKYRKQHGYIAYLDYKQGLDDEKLNIAWASHWADAGDAIINTMLRILDLDCDAALRLNTAARCLRRWYEKTNWQYIPKDEMIRKLEEFVFNEKEKRWYE